MITNRQLIIEFLNNDYNTITGANIVAETMELTRTICDGNLKLGGCVAAKFEVKLVDVPPDKITGKRIRVWLATTSTTSTVIYPHSDVVPGLCIFPGLNTTSTLSTPLITGTIDKAERQDNRQIIKITAYDDMYSKGSKNMYTWYSQYAHYSGASILSTMLNSLLDKLGFEVRGYLGGVNMSAALSLSSVLVKDKYASNIQAVDIIKSANELMCCFGYCDGWGRYRVKTLSNTKTTSISTYKDLKFNEYITSIIDTITLHYGDKLNTKYGRATTDTSSCYYVDDNAVLNCCTDLDSVTTIIHDMGDTGKLLYSNYQYRPFELQLDGMDCDLGDYVSIATGYSDVPYCKSYIMSQKITGPLALMSTYSASGDQVLQGEDNSQ